MANLDRVTNIATIAVAICALTVAASTLYRNSAAREERARVEGDTVRVANWDALQQHGHTLGRSDATLTIVEFGDYECPYCAEAAPKLERFVANHPSAIKLIYRHWPLAVHKFSHIAARAAECAARQGKFWEMHRQLYAGQDSIGLLPFATFARAVGIADTAAFNECVTDATPIVAVADGEADARRAGLTGTPAIVIDGLRLSGGLDTVLLQELIPELTLSHQSRSGS